MLTSPRHRHHAIKQHLARIFDELMLHDGYGEFKVEIRLLKRGQKEVLIHCGKQYRYVIDFVPGSEPLRVMNNESGLVPDPENKAN